MNNGISNGTIINSGDMSLTSITSSVISLSQILVLAVQAVYTGAPVGNYVLKGSVDGITYTDITGSAVAISAAGDNLINLNFIGYNFLIAKYTKTSGTGNITVKFFGKG